MLNSSSSSESNPTKELTFQDLFKSSFLRAAVERLEFKSPTPVQRETIPRAIAGKDLIVQAQTGSGKTLAFVLPLLNHLEAITDHSETKGLIIVPTRELATQIAEVIQSVWGVRVPCLIGGASSKGQIDDIEQERRIVVGTPGRLLDFIENRQIDLKSCSYFVLDEADEMLSMGFIEDVERILSRLPAKKQGLFISATITPNVQMLARRFLKDAEKVTIDTPLDALPSIEHRYYEVGSELPAKASALCDLLETTKPRSAIIFCNTKSDTELVEVFLRRRGFDARRINSDLSQRQRDAVMGRIRSGELRFLVGTDIAARGIDIALLDAVVNYSLHEQPEVYVHRTGRTGRAGRSGVAMSLIGPSDFSAFKALQRETAVNLIKTPLPSEEDVIIARTAHFKELLDSARINVQERDIKIARSMLNENGANEPQSEQLLTLTSRLYRFTLEHMLKQQTVALEDELDDQPIQSTSRQEQLHSGRRSEGSGRGGRRDDNRRSGRGGRR